MSHEKNRRVIPVSDEELRVDKRKKVTGGVRVFKTVHEHEEVIDEPLQDTEVQVRRVQVGEFVDEPAETRQQGDTTIIPVHEEVVVTEKRLRLKEEIHVTRHETTRHRPQTVVVRREEADIERFDESEYNESTHHPER